MTLTPNLDAKPIDMDCHYYEPLDCFERYIDPKFKDLAIRVVTFDDAPMPRWAMGDRPLSAAPFAMSSFIPPPGAFAGMLAGKTEMRLETLINPADFPEFTERAPRLKAMDEQGIDAAFMISSVGLLCEYDFRDQPDAICANFR